MEQTTTGFVGEKGETEQTTTGFVGHERGDQTFEGSVEEILSAEEKKKKSVYIVIMTEVDYDLKLLRINPHVEAAKVDGKGTGFEDLTPLIHKNPPANFYNVRRFSVAALEPCLYFIGGSNLRDEDYSTPVVASNKVYAFNTLNNEWDSNIAPMHVGRLFSNVLVYDGKIYAFGYAISGVRQPDLKDDEQAFCFDQEELEQVAMEKWVEVYDPEDNSWSLVRSLTKIPSELLEQRSRIIHAVREEDEAVIFCTQGITLHFYKFSSRCWFSLSTEPFNEFGLYWSNTVAVFQSLVFWHHYGTIHAYGFQDYARPSDLLTLDDALDVFGRPRLTSCFILPPLSFLVYAGNGVLCLVYHCPLPAHRRELRFHTFELHLSPLKERLSLHGPLQSQFCQAEEHDLISTVLTM